MPHPRDDRSCADCGTAYDHLRHKACPICAELTWAVWDAEQWARPAPDPERGIYEEGFPSKAAAEAAIPRIQASLTEAGVDVPRDLFLVRPELP